MGNWLKKNQVYLYLLLLLFIGFVIRLYFVDKIVVGDLLNYGEWGNQIIHKNAKYFYFASKWYYSVPVYPPVSIWMFAGLSYLNEHKYILAQMHNAIKFPPSVFIIYFYKWGEILLLKLPSIICDLFLSIIIYKLIFKLTKNKIKAIIGFAFFLFNPISIFNSGYWGQTDSIVAVLGLAAFLTLVDGNFILSTCLLFLSIYFKPSWSILIPFYGFITILVKPKDTQFLLAVLSVITLFILTTQPFANESVFTYGYKLYKYRYPIPNAIEGKASISAFNFQTIFLKIDMDFAKSKIIGIGSSIWGSLFFLTANIISFINYKKQKDKIFGMLAGIFTISMSAFMFMPGMLERYFYPALGPMIILAFAKPKLLLQLVVMNIIFFLNIIYSFYRRGDDFVYHLFIDNNFLIIRILSLIQVLLFATFVKPLVLQFKRG